MERPCLIDQHPAMIQSQPLMRSARHARSVVAADRRHNAGRTTIETLMRAHLEPMLPIQLLVRNHKANLDRTAANSKVPPQQASSTRKQTQATMVRAAMVPAAMLRDARPNQETATPHARAAAAPAADKVIRPRLYKSDNLRLQPCKRTAQPSAFVKRRRPQWQPISTR